MSNTYNPKKRFLPKTLGETIVHECTDESGDIKPRPIVTFLIGSGFSASSGIPMASQVVDLIKSKKFPKVEDPNRPPKDPSKSDYQYFMGFLTQTQQARIIRESVDKAYDKGAQLFRINHAHLLLALMAKEGYINRILTVNFDPLVVEALSLVNARIRTFDVSAAGRYPQDVFEPGTVIYMHGQVHSQLMCSEEYDLEEVKQHYRDVLQEAVRDSFVVVCGYSGECDPLVDVLNNHNRYPQGIWWSSFDPEAELKEGARNLLQAHQSDSHLSDQLGADNFMDQLVFDGMGLTFPEIIRDPSEGMIKSLEHIVPMQAGEHREDVIGEAIEALKQRRLEQSTTLPEPDQSGLATPPLPSRLDIAFARTPERLKELAARVPKNLKDAQSNAIGDAFCRQAGRLLDERKSTEALALLKLARAYGTTQKQANWVLTQEGNALSQMAIAEKELGEKRKLWEQAYVKQADAVKIKPDFHEALSNWASALDDQAKVEPDLAVKRKLWEKAYAKYAEAVRIKPDCHEALSNWGAALDEQAKVEPDLADKRKLLEEAYAKYADAVKIKPDFHEALSNWASALDEQAQIEPELSDKRKLWEEANAKYAEAVRIKPDFHEALNNWGNGLDQQALIASELSDKRKLREEAYVKYAEAVKIKPDKHETFDNWASVLIRDGHELSDPALSRAKWREALQKSERAIALAPDSHWFNNACCHSLLGNLEAALAALRNWKQFESSASKPQVRDDKDFDPIRNEPDFIEFYNSLPD